MRKVNFICRVYCIIELELEVYVYTYIVYAALHLMQFKAFGQCLIHDLL